MTTITLETFPPRTRLACCGTCEAWREQRHPETKRSEAYCPRLGIYLYDNMEAIGCAAWRQEMREPFALALYETLYRAGVR